MKKLFARLAISALTASALWGCASPRSQAPALKTLVLGDTSFNPENEQPDINPHNSYSGWSCLRYGVGETLFRYSDTMEIQPWLAKDFRLRDPLTWEIHLQDQVYFTSGRRMDAQAVKECLEHLIQVHARARGDLMIQHIEDQGQTLIIQTTRPQPALLNYLSDPYGAVIDMEAGITSDGIVSGTGPYKALSLDSGQKLELVKNEHYWNGTPKLDKITILNISDGDTLTMALQSGEIDAAYGMPYASYPLFENSDYTFSSCPTSRTFFLRMNFESPLIQDPAVRKAISMGIDKEGFVETLLGGNGYAAWGPWPEGFLRSESSSIPQSWDPEEARQILEEAGWKDTDGDGIREKDQTPLSIRWLTYPSRQELPILAETAQATLKEIGIEVSIQCVSDHNQVRNDPSQWDVYAASMVTVPMGDPEYFFASCCLKDSPMNSGHYYSSRLEAIAQDLSASFDPDQRARLADEMAQILLEDNGFVFCSYLQMSMISKSQVAGLKAHPCDYYEITADLDIKP